MDEQEYARFIVRCVRALGRRVELLDTSSLKLFKGIQDALTEAQAMAVASMRDDGASWAEIGDGLGITRQAAQQRWGAN